MALALAAHQLKRRRRKKKQVGPEMGAEQLGTVPMPILMARRVPSVKKGRSALGEPLTFESHLSTAPCGSQARALLPHSPVSLGRLTAEPVLETPGSGVLGGVGNFPVLRN